MKILLVYPAIPETFWSFKHVLPFVGKKAAYPPLGLVTVAAMLPRAWDFKLIDMNVQPLERADIEWADYVMVSAMLVQEQSVREVAKICAAMGKTLIGGGPLFTTGHERFPEIPHFVLGEAEGVVSALVEDLEGHALKGVYRSPEKPDVHRTPLPRWDLINCRQYATMAVQFSRGCPFDCEFCDIVGMYGRVPRMKTPAQMLAELDVLLESGWKDSIFIVDDNFIGHKAKAKDLLRAIIDWRRRRKVRVSFITEASLNLADDDELLGLMVEAGFKKVFIGLETPEEAALKECSKIQNTSRNMSEAVRKIQSAGMEVMGGFIVGFDADCAGIFDRQRNFIQEAGVVTAMLGLLQALPQTRLFARLRAEGRLLDESTGNNTQATLNFIPKLDRETLIEGYRSLVRYLYSPEAFYRRSLTFLAHYQPSGPKIRYSWTDFRAFLASLWIIGFRTPGRRAYWKYLAKSLLMHPHAFGEAVSLAIFGHHFRRVAASV